jgi:ribosomal protein S18 acetylase RimI-like enzyme
VSDRPQPDASDLRLVRPEETPALATALARAFHPNPGMSWTFRDPERRKRQLETGFAHYFRSIWLPRGECWTADGVNGAAVWMPPGRWELPLSAQVRLLPGVIRSAGRDTARVLRFFGWTEKRHPHEPHWYLLLLGIDPEQQGRGYGSHLMRPVLERCDADGVPAYLETDTERNVALYERHGFRTRERAEMPGGGPPIWFMWREPR